MKIARIFVLAIIIPYLLTANSMENEPRNQQRNQQDNQQRNEQNAQQQNTQQRNDPKPQRGYKDLVRVVGRVEPRFSVSVSDFEIQNLASQMQGLQDNLVPLEVNINSLFQDGDEEAISKASLALSQNFLNASQKMIDLKAMVYKLGALLSVDQSGFLKETLYETYSQSFQNTYNGLIRELAYIDDELQRAILLCRSEICVISIYNAKKELITLGKKLNVGISIDQLDDIDIQWQFSNSLNMAVVEKTWEMIMPDNERVSAPYSVLLAGAFSTFVAAAAGTVNIGKLVYDVILGGRMIGFELDAHPIDMRYLDFSALAFDDLAYRKISSIVNNVPIEQVGHRKMTHHINIIQCSNQGDYNTSGHHFLLYGINTFRKCANMRTDDQNLYTVSLETYGPGIAFPNAHNIAVIIKSPAEINPLGTWVGVDAEVTGVLSAEVGILVGKSASVVSVWGLGYGTIGAAAGISVLKIKFDGDQR